MSTSTDQKFVSAFSLFPKSYNAIKRNWKLFAIINSVSLVMTILSALNGNEKDALRDTSGTMTINWAAVLGVSLGIGIILLVIGAVLQVMALRLELSTAQEKSTNLQQLWEFARKYFFRLVGLGIVGGAAIVGGLILLIVPGIILITRFFFAPYIMIDKDLGIIDSLKASSEMSKDAWGPIWSVIGVILLISIVPSWFGSVGAIVAALLGIAYSVAPAYRYLELKKATK